MNRFFTILEGEGKGLNKPLTSALMIVGRSKNADLQIEDALVSRRHLEVRVEADGVFIENKSTSGSVLNGKPLVGVVSLNPGDVLEIGHTKLRYDEAAAVASPAGRPSSAEAMESEIDGTRIADENLELRHQRDKEAEPDATRAIVEADGTRMLNPSELPNWVAQENKQKAGAGKGGGLAVFVVLLLLAVGGAAYWYWFVNGKSQTSEDSTMTYKDSMYSFNLDYPLDWSKTTDTSGVISFGFGKEGDPAWGQLNIFTDKDPEYALTGLTDGFVHYQDVLKKRYKDFELGGSKTLSVNNATVIYYAFSTPALEGKGIYTLNADERIVVECVAARTCYEKYNPRFSSILHSFELSGMEAQQVIDFPLPDEGMQQLALASPSQLSRQVDEHIKMGDMLLATKDVKPDNLFNSAQEYKKALQLSIAAPQRLSAYPTAAQGLSAATTQLNQALEQQRFEINRSLKSGDRTAAYWAANKMMQMIPDKTDDNYQAAYKLCRSLKPSD
jgi:hypothetical protein